MSPRGTEYVELHAASAFSFLRGGSGPEALADAAAAAGLEAVALCDRDGVYGAPRFHKACRERGLRAIVGAELTLAQGGILPVLVENATGYANLCRLITGARLRAKTKDGARFTWEEIAEHAEGLVALSGDADEGALARACAGGGDGADRFLERLKRCFPGKGQCHVEMQHHRRRGDPGRLRELAALAERHGLPVLASNGVRHATARERKATDVFTCLRHHTHLDAAGRLLACNAERHVKSAEQMRALFREYPHAPRATLELSERLRFSLEDPGYRFPEYPVPAGESMDSFLRKLTWFGAEQRYGGLTPGIRRQLEHELNVIAHLGFSGYFLIVWDIVNFCRESDIMVQGRGSAANSAVCYSLGITAVDPIGCGLLFERFLSEGRQGWPDIDLDLPSGDRRERVIQEVYRRHGRRGAAMTANVITYRGRGAVREIGKALNFPRAMIDRFSALYSGGGGEDGETATLEARLEEAGIRRDHPRTPVLTDLCGMILGLPRHLGQHSGGMIVCAGRLDSVVPLEPASMPGRVVAQWDKDDCEDLGIVKVDLLGLGMMAAMQDSLRYARERGHSIDLAHIPKDDSATFAMMRAADTIGVFQIESRAQQATLPRMKPACFYDVAIEVAIIRPGPVQGNLVHPYLERRRGRAPVDYIDARLRPVLERTLGVPLFQEQMLRIAMILADFTGAEAEELRRALNFHRSPERLRRAQGKLRAAMEQKGVCPKVMDAVIAASGSFALYGFPESHAISFALIAYASTYLKAHYPAEFYCGLLNNQPMGFYSPATLIQDARRRGIRFRSPCVASSSHPTTVVDDRLLQLGLSTVRGLRRAHIEGLLEERAKRAFSCLDDFRRRTLFDEAALRQLARSGALRVFGGDRRRTLWEVEEALDWEDGLAVEEDGRGGSAGDGASATRDKTAPDDPREAGPPVGTMSLLERIQADYETLGLTAGPHPMRLFRQQLRGMRRAADLPGLPDGCRVTVGGAVICRQRPATAKGFLFISLEDETGVINVVTTPAFHARWRRVIVESPFLECGGKLQNREGVIHVRAQTVRPLGCEGPPAGASHDFH